ncbi:S26 family signal peptidase [Mesorhizobium sp. IMUNJ 23232]|uniref:S26 family signal peptidase n=1 Tax=Mesorhizobium sp. IMUNJ 23232 TaxID=3376064 RepID=UPI0037BC1088
MSAREAIVAAMLAGVGLISASTWSKHPRFVWNASASVPIGLYRVEPAERIDVADLVVVMPPEPLASLLAERGYLPRGVPLIKRVLALAGTTVCRRGVEIAAYGMTYGRAREFDSHGRRLPDRQGCGVVAEGEAFLMNWDAEDSFDSRYFGPLPLASIVGRAVPVWTADDTDTAPASAAGSPAGEARAPHSSATKGASDEQDRHLHLQR